MQYTKLKMLAASLLFGLGSTAVSAQDLKCTSWEAHPKGVTNAKNEHTAYRDLFKVKKYAEALPLWEALFALVTTPKEAPSRHFKDGIDIYFAVAKTETDAAKKTAYLDKAAKLYDHLYKCVGETADDRAYQGYNMYANQMDAAQTIAVYERCLEIGKKETPYFAIQPYATLAVFMFNKSAKFDKAYMLKLYSTLKEICETNIQSDRNKLGAQYKTAWDGVQAEFSKIEGQIFDCSYFEPQFRKEYTELIKGEPATKTAETLPALETYFNQLRDFRNKVRTKCGDETPVTVEITENFNKVKTVYEKLKFESGFDKLTPYEKYAYLHNRNEGNDRSEAAKWLEKAFDNPATGFPAGTTNEEKAKSAYRIADGYFRDHSYGTARSWARKASDLRPGWGDPYILVGLMYASSGKACSGGVGTGWDAQVVVWAAMDEWNKAKSVDGSVADEANKYIGKYREFLPTVGEGFQKNIKEGSSYKIGCWIGVTTTARFKK
jgi:tetratricopeptide (TPR) repeat protein